jgi:hypothetical protein
MKLLLASAIALAVGCTSNAGDVNDGATIAGTPFTAVGTAAMVRSNRGLTNIELTDFADVCSTADESEHATSKTLRFLLADYQSADDSVPPTHPGSYRISKLADPLPTSGPYAECGFQVDDGTCQPRITPCDSGDVTLTRADATGYAGSFDVVIAGDHVTGTFDTMNCPGVSESGFGTCH